MIQPERTTSCSSCVRITYMNATMPPARVRTSGPRLTLRSRACQETGRTSGATRTSTCDYHSTSPNICWPLLLA